jgi:hypothetical protein
MTLEQQLLMDLHALPPEQQAEVADFAAVRRHEKLTPWRHRKMTPAD